jgi:hypothetical protein
VGALAILGIGIWTLEAEYGSKQLSKLIDADLYKIDSYLMIVTGSAIIAITLLGFCGVFTRIKCVMGLVSTVHVAAYKKLEGTWVFLSYMRVFLYPSLLNKEDVWPGTIKVVHYKRVFFYASFL